MIEISYHMAMTLQELRYLVAIADHCHFGRAAAACHVTQPTLSAGLRKLEDELGLALCERSRRGALIATDAEPLVAQARRVLAEAQRLEELARHRLAPLAGVFRLGAIPTVGPYLFPRVVPGLREQHPDLALHLYEEKTARLLDDLRAGRLDAALMSPPLDEDGLERVDLYREPFLAALPAGHPLAHRRRLRMADLEEQPLLLLDEGHCLRDQVLGACRLPGTPVRELLRASSLETLRSMVAAGVGATLLPALAVGGDLPDAPVRIVPFMRPVPRRTVSLYWRRGFPRAESARLLGATFHERLPADVEAIGGKRGSRS
jgi:LysR family hydrogen peroxide-inducible transcriptional activator